jgi:hypothetical protein
MQMVFIFPLIHYGNQKALIEQYAISYNKC